MGTGTTLTIPSIDMTTFNSAALAVFTALAVFVAIGFAIRMFKKA